MWVAPPLIMPEERGQHAADGADLAAVRVARRRQRVEVPEQLVGAVDEIDVQSGLLV